MPTTFGADSCSANRDGEEDGGQGRVVRPSSSKEQLATLDKKPLTRLPVPSGSLVDGQAPPLLPPPAIPLSSSASKRYMVPQVSHRGFGLAQICIACLYICAKVRACGHAHVSENGRERALRGRGGGEEVGERGV